MKIRNILSITAILLTILIISCAFKLHDYYNTKVMVEFAKHQKEGGITPSSLSMYDNLEKYSEEYDIPKYIAYNIAYLETRYQGPFDWKYKPNLTSSAGAVGPMQVMPKTANGIHKKNVPVKTLKNDIEFNVETSMILLNRLHKKYKDWGVVCGYYNTGYPLINDYAEFCVTNKNYKKNWIEFQ